MVDFTLLSFWLLAFAALYFMGPISIYFIGILALLCSLCSSSLSSATSSSVKVINLNDLQQMGHMQRGLKSQGSDIRVTRINDGNVKTTSIRPVAIPFNSFVQCGGNYGDDGFDMTADQVYAAFKQHPYDNENLGYGYYDGYDYVL